MKSRQHRRDANEAFGVVTLLLHYQQIESSIRRNLCTPPLPDNTESKLTNNCVDTKDGGEYKLQTPAISPSPKVAMIIRLHEKGDFIHHRRGGAHA